MENFKSKCTIRFTVRADDPGAVRYMVCYYTLKWFQEKLSHCLQIFRHSCYPRWPRVYNPDEWIGLYEHLFSLQGWKSVVLVTIEKSSQLWLYLEPWHPPTPITSRGTVPLRSNCLLRPTCVSWIGKYFLGIIFICQSSHCLF